MQLLVLSVIVTFGLIGIYTVLTEIRDVLKRINSRGGLQ